MTDTKLLTNKINSGNAGFLMGIVVLLVSSCLAFIFVHYQFAGYDMSLFVDLSWRLANNQIPGVDFINTMPPLLIIFIKLFSWGNLSWYDLTIANTVVTFGAYIFLYLMSDFREESIWWGLFIAIILSLPLVYTNHVWPSSLAQLTGILFFYAVYVAINSSELKTKVMIGTFLASGLLAISKQNHSLPLLSAAMAFIFFSKRNDRFILIALILLGVLSGIVSSMVYLGYSWSSFLYTYSAVMERALIDIIMVINLGILGVQNWITFFTFCSLILFIYVILEKKSKMGSANKIYLLIMFAASVIPILTDWDMKVHDIPLPLFIFTTATFLSIGMSSVSSVSLEQQHHFPFRILIAFVLLLSIYFVSALGGYRRENMDICGNDSFYVSHANRIIEKGYFSGLRTGDRLSGVLNEITLVKDEFPYQKIFFGICMEFGYLHTKTPSPHGMPLWWHPGTSHDSKDEKKITDNFINSEFDILIFLKKRTTVKMPRELLKFIANNYWIYDKYQYIDVYIIKSNSALFYNIQGNYYKNHGQYQPAINHYNKAVLTSSNDVIAYYNRGVAYSKLGRYQEAIKDYSEAVHLKPDFAAAYDSRGAVYLTQNNTGLGCSDARKACELGTCRLLKLAESHKVCP